MDSSTIAVFFFSCLCSSFIFACPPECNSCQRNTADCQGAGLRDIPKNFPEGLTTIDLTSNKLTDLQEGNFPNLPSVQNLRLPGNGISNIAPRSFKTLENLMSLDLSGNPITIIQDGAFEGLTKLRTLSLTNTNLKMIGKPFKEMSNVYSLNLGYNKLTKIEEDDFVKNERIGALDLSNNRISTIHPDAFKNLKMLRYLILKNNQITQASGLKFSATMLQLVDFSSCKLMTVPSPMPASVADFRLGHNEISEIKITDFENMTNLQLLTLNSNKIKSVEYKAFTTNVNLEELWLNQNRLPFIPRGLPQNLMKLYVDMNKVYDIEPRLFAADAKLESISISMNKVHRISKDAFQGLKNLTTVNLKDNIIEELQTGTFSDLDGLITLDISSNPLKIIQSNAFKNLPNLDMLDMSYQEEATVMMDKDFIEGIQHTHHLQFMNSPGLAKKFLQFIEQSNNFKMPKLKILNLQYNELETLPEKLKEVIKNVKVLYLDGNPLACDKRLLWLQQWMKSSDIKFYSLEPPTCSSPDEVKNRELKSLTLNEFPEGPTTNEVSTETTKSQPTSSARQTFLNKVVATISNKQKKTDGQITSGKNGAKKPKGKQTNKKVKKGKGKRGKGRKKKKRVPKKPRKPKRKRNRRKKKKGKKGKRGKRRFRQGRKCTKLPNGDRKCCRTLKSGEEKCRIRRPKPKPTPALVKA